MIKPVILIGSTGQVGQSLKFELAARNIHFVSPRREEFNLRDLENIPTQLERLCQKIDPSWIVNAGAYTDVARAETEKAEAYLVNAQGPGAIARFCAQKGIRFISYSTDYVFDGRKPIPYIETDAVNPLNGYGRSKVAGEKEIVESRAAALIFRTSWIYSPAGKNFLLTMLKLGMEREELSVVSDQIGAPSYAPDLARATVKIIEKIESGALYQRRSPSGLYHMCNGGKASWFEFAEKIFEKAKETHPSLKIRKVSPVLTKDYPSQVVRPLNSLLSTQKLKDTFDVELRDYELALEECMRKLEVGK